MANPNEVTNNFVLKVYDPVAKEFRPSYVAPYATSSVAGDVKLSDATDSTLNAASGLTAATPAAVRTVQNNANNKLDMKTSTAQSVTSAVTFNNAVTGSNGITVPSGKYFTGNLKGNATTATALQTAATFGVSFGDGAVHTVSSDLGGTSSGGAVVTINIPGLDASAITSGTIDISHLPQGALERIVTVADQAARYKLTTDNVQLGDTVKQTDTGVMYIVVDESNLGNANGYMEYAASTAVKATSADSAAKLTTARNIKLTGNVTGSASFNGTADASIATTIGSGVITSAMIKDGTIAAEDVGFNYAGSSSKGGVATSAAKVTNALTIKTNGTTKATFNGSAATSIDILASDVGALPLSGGTMTGAITSNVSGTGFIGTASSALSANSAAKLTTARTIQTNLASTSTASFDGTANITPGVTGVLPIANGGTGNANGLAAGWSKSLTLTSTGDVAGSVSFSGSESSSTVSQTLTIASGAVTNSKLGSSSVSTAKIQNSAVTTAKVADDAITLSKLASDVGTVYVGTTEPTDSNVKIWINA